MHVRAAAWFLLLIGTAGCAVPGRPDVDGARFVALTVTAPSASVTVINAEPQTLPYRAAGTTPAGEVVDVSDVVTWSVSDDLGTFAAAVLNVPGTAAGAGIVTARLDDLVATADLEVFATHRRVDPGLPDDIVARFDTSTRHPDRHLELAYPPADVVVPPNLATLPIHWHRQADRAFYRLRVSSPYRRVERFLPATPNDNEIVPVPWDEWAFVTDDARDGEVWFDVAGLALDSGALVESEVRRVRVAAADLEGALYFFSVDEAAELSSLRRLDVGRPRRRRGDLPRRIAGRRHLRRLSRRLARRSQRRGRAGRAARPGRGARPGVVHADLARSDGAHHLRPRSHQPAIGWSRPAPPVS
jgi:hypothetical protein